MQKIAAVKALPLAMLLSPVSVMATANSGAEDQAAAATSATDPASASTASPRNQNSGIADIVVTATRREERLQRIPVTVTAISGSALTTRGILQSTQLSEIVPGLTFTRSASVGLPVIRGVGSTGVSVGDESNVATYVDGVYQADPFSTILEFVNVQRIEVLRGPQGTVFGRNATGGLINVITPDPTFTTSGTITGTYGRMRNDANDFDIRGSLNGPITDKLAGYLSAYYIHDDGYVKDLLRGGALGGREVASVRGKLLFQPSSSASIILTGEYGRQNASEVAFQPAGTQIRGKSFAGVILPTQPWETSVDTYPRNNYRRALFSLRTKFDLGFANLETTGAYIFSHADQITDSDATNISLAYTTPDYRTRTYSQEIRLLSKSSGRFTWLAGFYAFHLNGSSSAILANAISPPTGPLSIVTIAPTIRTTSFAGFAEGTLELSEKLFLTVGDRYTYERRSFTTNFNGNLLIPTTERSYRRDTYRAALRYQITPSTNIYGSYGTGFKSGVFNTVTTVLNAVNPETIKAAEIGIKSDVTRGLRTNLSIYRYDYTGLQVNSRAPSGAFILQNAATAKIYGGELEVTAVPVQGLTLNGNVSYTHARYGSFPNAQSYAELASGANSSIVIDASGNRLVRTPDWTASLGGSYRHELSSGAVVLNSNVFWSDRVYWDFSNLTDFSQKPYALVGAGIAYESKDHWRVELAATNLFDEVVATQIQVAAQGTVRLLQRPRRVTLSLGYSF